MTLVGHWPLNEDSGDALDYSGNENHGTVNGATQGVTGILGETAYSFDGTSNSVEHTSEIIPGPTDVTISLWFNASATGVQELYRSHVGSYTDIRIGYDMGGDQRVTIQFADSSSSVSSSSTSSTVIQTGSWEHIAVTFKQPNNTGNLYINSVEEASVSEAWDSGVNMYLANTHGDGSFFNGKISNVRLYNRALTPHEIQYLYSVPQSASMTSRAKTL